MILSRLKRLTLVGLIMVVIVLFIGVLGIALSYYNQDHIVNEAVSQLNKNFNGRLEIRDSHISPFKNFPYISIDLEGLQVYESKSDTSDLLMDISDTYVGFEIWSILEGTYEIKRIRLENGFIKLVQHTDGSFNLMNVFTSSSDAGDEGESLHLDLKTIRLTNIDLLKLNETNNILVEAFVEDAFCSLKTNEDEVIASLDTQFEFNLIIDNDTSFINHKKMELITSFNFFPDSRELMIAPSEVFLENALFLMSGSIDVDDNMNLDLKFSGNKPNFDLFLAFMPEDLAAVLEKYDNGGRIFFKADVKGPSINGFNPKVDVDFGCEEAFIHNVQVDKEVNDLFFEGHFTNGESQNLSTMSLVIEDFSARPETGNFSGNLTISNFESPDIDLKIISDFDLEFLAEFLEIRNLSDVTGNISLEMNFHDIIDLDQPEKSIEKLNESYFTRLEVKDLNFKRTDLPYPVSDVNILASMDGHEAVIEQMDFKLGKSDVEITASVSDLPAIIHHTDIPVKAVLDIKSSLLDLNELTIKQTDSLPGISEKIKDLSVTFSFNSSARAFTESPNLPIGEFFIDSLYAEFANYPHRLHDFHADVQIDSTSFRVIDFTGMIDQSDFHFNGRLENYDLWFEENPVGSTNVDFNLNSELIQLHDLFSYGGENYVPEDYRHEEFRNLNLHGVAALDFRNTLQKTSISLDKLEANMKVHPMRFERFNGDIYIDSTMIQLTEFSGKLGNSEFTTDFTYFFNSDSLDIPHTFKLESKRLDFDQLFSYNPPPDTLMTPEMHEAGFNIFEVPFANIEMDLRIDQLNYHRYDIRDFNMIGSMHSNHFIFVDTLSLKAAGGSLGLNGYFNGKDPKSIHLSPNLEVRDIDLDKLLIKFENFGQDQIVSENLHGALSGNIYGKVHVHADMTPIIDDSNLHLDIEVVDGSINNFPAFEALSDYFTDKNLNNVRFDTLSNDFDLKDGVLTIPNMKINSTLGYFEISGQQSVSQEMDYYLRIPLKVVTRAGMKKLFSKKDQDNTDQVDEIQYRDEDKRIRFLNVRIQGTPDDYKITLDKDKDKEDADSAGD